jgi:hypothetical protein
MAVLPGKGGAARIARAFMAMARSVARAATLQFLISGTDWR